MKNNIGRFATVLKETNEFIGWTGIKYIDDHVENGNTNFYDYGYRLAEKFWGKGYATEASIAWLTYGFNQIHIDKLHANFFKNMVRSTVIFMCIGIHFVNVNLIETIG